MIPLPQRHRCELPRVLELRRARIRDLQFALTCRYDLEELPQVPTVIALGVVILNPHVSNAVLMFIGCNILWSAALPTLDCAGYREVCLREVKQILAGMPASGGVTPTCVFSGGISLMAITGVFVALELL